MSPIQAPTQDLFVGDLVKERYPSPSRTGHNVFIVTEVDKAGSFVRLNGDKKYGWHFNDDLVLISRTNKLKERDQ